MAQWIKTLLYIIDDLGLIPETHVKMEGENQFHKVVLEYLHMCNDMSECSSTHTTTPTIPMYIIEK